MTENRNESDSFENNPKNLSSHRENHVSQSLYSELKQLRKKPKSDDHLPHSHNHDESQTFKEFQVQSTKS